MWTYTSNCISTKEPPYAERHVRWCERSENESRKKTTSFSSYSINDAKPFTENRLAKTYLFCDDTRIVGYFCLLNDKLSKQEIANSDWRKIKKLFPHSKHLGSYPAVKIGRFAISLQYRNQGLGKYMMYVIKEYMRQDPGYSAFRFLTVDAYQEAISFYEKNGFKKLVPIEERSGTQAMYFDIKSVLVP